MRAQSHRAGKEIEMVPSGHEALEYELDLAAKKPARENGIGVLHKARGCGLDLRPVALGVFCESSGNIRNSCRFGAHTVREAEREPLLAPKTV
jgi:hypothetical protein